MENRLQELYQEVILDHSRNPRNHRPLDTANRRAEGYNPLCGDRVTVFVQLEEDVIKDITFQGSGCAISKAAASLMTSCLKGKTRAEVLPLVQKFRQLVTTGLADTAAMDKLAVFAGVHQFPTRIKCAVLPWHALLAALEDRATPVSTESGNGL